MIGSMLSIVGWGGKCSPYFTRKGDRKVTEYRLNIPHQSDSRAVGVFVRHPVGKPGDTRLNRSMCGFVEQGIFHFTVFHPLPKLR